MQMWRELKLQASDVIVADKQGLVELPTTQESLSKFEVMLYESQRPLLERYTTHECDFKGGSNVCLAPCARDSGCIGIDGHGHVAPS